MTNLLGLRKKARAGAINLIRPFTEAELKRLYRGKEKIRDKK